MEHTVTITRLADNLWDINEPWYTAEEKFGHMTVPGKPYVESYLILGEKKAALIDCLMDYVSPHLPEIISGITPLPVEVVFTHGHGDHAGLETEYLIEAGYPLRLSHLDIDMMVKNADSFFGLKPWMKAESFIDLREGDKIDLGGTVLEAFSVPGHTLGSICLVDRAGHRVFTGDAFGTIITGQDFLMDGVTKIDEYIENTKRFEEFVGDGSFILYNGHLANVGMKPWTLDKLSEARARLEDSLKNR